MPHALLVAIITLSFIPPSRQGRGKELWERLKGDSVSRRDGGVVENKETLRGLRQARKKTIAAATLRMKEQRKAVKVIRTQLQAKAGTVPELAEATGIPSAEVMWYLATMKRYGQIIEAEKDGSYFRYELAGSVTEEADD
jgi:predicted transcriptional regulator